MQKIMMEAKKIQGEMERLTKQIESTVFSFKNENINIEALGSNLITKVEILNPSIMEDKEILEDIIFVGVNNVLDQIKKEKENKLGKYTGGMGGLF